MADFTLPENIVSARESAQAATQRAGEFGAAEYTIGDVLKQKALEAYNANKDIVGKLDPAIASYVSAPAVGREKYQDIFNPFQREALVSQYTGTQAIPMQALSSVLGQRFGRIEDTVGAGTRAFQAQSATELARAEQEQQLYQDLLGEYETTEGLRQTERGLDISEAKGAGDGGLGDIFGALLAANPVLAALLNKGKNIPTFEEPPYSSPLNQSTQVEHPEGSGIIWAGDGQGGWM